MKTLSVLTLAGALFAVSGSAAPIFYTDRASFQAAAGALLLESFETPYPVGLPSPSIPYTDFTVSETNGIDNITSTAFNTVFGTVPVTDGSAAIWFDDNENSLGVFAFNRTITAFGIDITIDASAGSMAVGGDVSTSINLAVNTPTFFGVIDTDGFTNLTFGANSGPVVGFDRLEYSDDTGVPEPSTVGLLGLGLAAIVVRRMRA